MTGKNDPSPNPRSRAMRPPPCARRLARRVRASLAGVEREGRLNTRGETRAGRAGRGGDRELESALRTATLGEEELLARDVDGPRAPLAQRATSTTWPRRPAHREARFTGRLGFAPVRDLANAGFALTGGRLDYVNGRAVAALTYKYRQHVVNVFVWPAADAQEVAPIAFSRQGYSILHWNRGAMRYWAVADVAPAQLAVLAEALN